MNIDSQRVFEEALKEIARLSKEMIVERTARLQLMEEIEAKNKDIGELISKNYELEKQLKDLQAEGDNK